MSFLPPFSCWNRKSPSNQVLRNRMPWGGNQRSAERGWNEQKAYAGSNLIASKRSRSTCHCGFRWLIRTAPIAIAHWIKNCSQCISLLIPKQFPHWLNIEQLRAISSIPYRQLPPEHPWILLSFLKLGGKWFFVFCSSLRLITSLKS